MVKFPGFKFGTFILSLLLCLSILWGNPSAAMAGKAIKSFAFDPANPVVNVATIYETTPETQKSALSSTKASKSLLKSAPGFEGLSVLKSEDGNRVIVLSQWQDLASYETFSTQLAEAATGSKFKKGEAAVAPARTIVFEVGKVQADAGITPALKGKEAIVQFSEFTLKDPADQPKLISSIEKMMPEALLKKPSPQSAVLLQSTDGTDVALLANWNCTVDFAEGVTPTAFDAPTEDVIALADNDLHTYDVVRIMPAKVKEAKVKEEKEED
ncbi:antibiotic biosynthesis monooxygenase [Phormidium tenue FACHB-886]|nr:antibiotic biosynthesis monooxygenase [Phormidium tenue FACHB-886]